MNLKTIIELQAASGEKTEKRTFTLEGRPDVLDRIEEFLNVLQTNGNIGHSGTFAMGFDGDGWDKVKVTPKPRIRKGKKLKTGRGAYEYMA